MLYRISMAIVILLGYLSVASQAVWAQSTKRNALTEIRSWQFSDAVDDLAFSGSDDTLVVLLKGPKIARCTVEEKTPLVLFEGTKKNTIVKLAASADGMHVYGGRWRTGPNKEFQLLQFDAKSGVVKNEFRGPPLIGLGIHFTSDPVAVSVSADGKWVAVGTKLVDEQYFVGGHIGGEVCVLEVETGKVLWNNTTTHANIVRSVTFSPDARFMASVGEDALIRIWDPRTGELHKTLVGTLWGGANSLQFSLDGKYLATGGQGSEEGGCVGIWDVDQGKLLHKISGGFQRDSSVHVQFGSDGKLFAVGASNESTKESPQLDIRAYNPASGRQYKEFHTAGVDGHVRAFAIQPQKNVLAVGTFEGKVRVYSAR